MSREWQEAHIRALFLELSFMYDPEDDDNAEFNDRFESVVDEAMRMGVNLT